MLQLAFIDVTAYLPCWIHFVSIVANTSIRPHKILASTIDADVRILGALVDIYVFVSFLQLGL